MFKLLSISNDNLRASCMGLNFEQTLQQVAGEIYGDAIDSQGAKVIAWAVQTIEKHPLLSFLDLSLIKKSWT